MKILDFLQAIMDCALIKEGPKSKNKKVIFKYNSEIEQGGIDIEYSGSVVTDKTVTIYFDRKTK